MWIVSVVVFIVGFPLLILLMALPSIMIVNCITHAILKKLPKVPK